MRPKILQSRIIRNATAADAAGIARVHCQSHVETYRPFFGADYTGPSEAQRRAHWQKRLELGDVAFVALDCNEIVGFTHAQEEADARATMTTLYLLKAYHRRGIGRDLMAMLLHHLHTRGYAEAHFGCLPQNAQAIAFYKSQGARENGLIVNHHGDQTHEDLMFIIPTRSDPR
jgi:ribosomal protein S18 acetylase RimI-like enzyme